MMFSVSFPEWELKTRLQALRDIGLRVVFEKEYNCVDVKYNNSDVLGGPHTQAAKFICDPVFNPVMYNMDKNIGLIVSKLHHAFWLYKHGQNYFNEPEDLILKELKKHLKRMPCKEQDKWLEIKPEELKEKLIKDNEELFNSVPVWAASTGHMVSSGIMYDMLHDESISWTRIHSQLFQP